VADALYTFDGPDVIPGPLTVGPWSPDAQHGGPVAALLTRAVEAAPAAVAMQVGRVTVELVRPVPVTPLRLATHVSRPGRNVQLVEVSLTADGTEVARARGLRLRVAAVPVPVPVPVQDPDPASPPPPDPGSPRPDHDARTRFLGAVDLRFVKGSWDELGPATVWGRLVVPVVAGEEPSSMQQLAAIADFGNGISRIVDFGTHRFINPDLTVAVSRRPVGRWIGLEVVTRLADTGFGQAEGRVFDELGPVGRSIQTLLLQPV
jgi:hypothetical protein